MGKAIQLSTEEYFDRIIRVISFIDFKRTFGVILIILAWMGIAPSFYEMITQGAIGQKLSRIYNLFNGNGFLNTAFCISIVLFFFRWIKRIKNNVETLNTTKYYCLFLIGFFFLVLYWRSPLVYANIVWIIDYRVFLSVLLVLPLLYYSFSIRNYYKRKNEIRKKTQECSEILYLRAREEGLIGFTTDNINLLDISDDLIKYANSIVYKFLSTNVSDESFAIGITSEWGAGKTTFLNVLKNEIVKLKPYTDIVEFNPWMCRTPEQVTSDFFSSLRHQLSNKHPELSSPIKKYAKYLKSASLQFKGLTLTFSDFISEKSLYEKKKELSERFSLLTNKIVVFIDDMDRLESNEVLEVLRLIRNTADLKKVIFIVAFDKEYVTTVLEEKKIADPSSYLEKIFQVEIQLPLVPKQRILSTLFSEIISNRSYRNRNDSIKMDFFEKNQDLICKVINSYRKAKRFARLFSLNYEHLSKYSFNPLEWQDVFWLELLQVSDKSTYDYYLCNNPKAILREDKDCYFFDEKYENNEQRFKNKPITKDILLKLFGELGEGWTNEYSVRNTQYYNQYFTMEVQFSKADLKKLLDTDDVDLLVKEWGEKGKPIDSLSRVVRDYDKKQLNEKKGNLINGLFLMAYYSHDNGFHFAEEVFAALDIDGIEELKKWFADKLTKGWKLSNISRVLSCFEYLLDSQKVVEGKAIMEPFNEKTIDKFFEKHPQSTVLDLKRENGDLVNIYKGLSGTSKNYFLDCLLKRYSQMFNKPARKEFDAIEIENGSVLSELISEKDRYMQIIRDECCRVFIQKTQRRYSFAAKDKIESLLNKI